MKRSYIYFNLQRRVWSERQAGKVVAHPEYVVLKDARFLVGKAGQARVRAEGRKNVHAGVSGLNITHMVQAIPLMPDGALSIDHEMHWHRVTYNPYKHDSFVRLGGQYGPKPIASAKHAVMLAEPGMPPVVWAYQPR